ncbi:MAG: SusC/RagA family TonB-linked outer membrane protein [Sphingobacterium sp.]|jgi:TonB-linked SusC/RagA family outer membrane protein|nr:SusC/RagA family TonB-linked outer membrane protein [Sphingobacterium sp.]
MIKRSKSFSALLDKVVNIPVIQITILVILFLLVSMFSLSAQTPRKDSGAGGPTPLQIGDTVPEILWNLPLSVVNHPQQKDIMSLNDYKEKLIILDFWATWCGSCIKSFPKLDSLHAEFKDDLQVLLINSIKGTGDTKEKVMTFFSKQDSRLHFPSVVNDTIFKQVFPRMLLPHFVWIDRHGVVVAITTSAEVNRENIRKVIAGVKVPMKIKDDFKPKNKQTLESNSNGNGNNRLKSQPFTLFGRVSLGAGSDNPAVTIKSKGNDAVVSTGAGGKFKIVVTNLPDTLLVSSVGYETKAVPVSDLSTALDIRLHSRTNYLDEVNVINTGYQTVKPNEINGSVVSLGKKELNEQSGTNILDRLKNMSSGLAFTTGKSNGNPQNSTNINIRGLSTINGPLDPLIVLDNFIYEGDIDNINPNDVENVSILKDAAAASIWGARAGNGVIVITTKRGKFNQPLKVGFNSNILISQKPNLYYYPQMPSSDYIAVEKFLFDKGYFDNQINTKPYSALTPAVDLFLRNRNGQITAGEMSEQIDRLKSTDIRDSYSKYFFKAGITQQQAVNINGGSEKHNYILSAAYDQSSDDTYAAFRKINLKTDQSFRPLKRLTITTGIYFTKSTGKSGSPGYNSMSAGNRRPVYLDFENPDGTAASIPFLYREAYTDTVGDGKLLDWKYYPKDDYKYNTTVRKQQEIYANAGLNYRPLDYLNIDVKYQYQNQTSDAENLAELQSYYARNMINSFSQLNHSTGIVKYIIPLGGIKSLNTQLSQSHTFRGQVNFEKTWGRHKVSAIVGAEMRQAQQTGSGNILYGYNSDPLTGMNLDYINDYPNFITQNTQSISSNSTLVDAVQRFVSNYANASYSFADRYLVSASLRKDGSNIFGANTNDRWKPLWSAGLGWNISKEQFYCFGWLPELKLTATYGHSGNVDLSRFALPVALFASNAITGFRFGRISTLNNPELKWEQASQLNLRLNFSLKDQVLAGSIEYYYKKGTDLYGNTPYDYTTWGRNSEIVKNVASMRGKGVDVILNSINIDRQIRWTSSLLFSRNMSRTTAYYSSGYQIMTTSRGTSITPFVGQPLYAVAAYRWGGLDMAGNPQGYYQGNLSTDYDKINAETYSQGINGNVVYKGSAVPVYFGSLVNTLQWKQFSASLNIGYKLGYYLFKPSISYSALVERGVGHSDFVKRWQNPGDELSTSVPSFIYPVNSMRDAFYATSEVNVIKGDHVRLNYVNLSYTFLLNKNGQNSPLSKIQLYVIASNLGMLWRANKAGIDPDKSSIYPEPKTIALGLRSNF